MSDPVLDALDPEQRAAAESLDGPLCVIAGAGTGKTRAVTHRIAYGVRLPPQPTASSVSRMERATPVKAGVSKSV